MYCANPGNSFLRIFVYIQEQSLCEKRTYGILLPSRRIINSIANNKIALKNLDKVSSECYKKNSANSI
jgi:hypothetical protein